MNKSKGKRTASQAQATDKRKTSTASEVVKKTRDGLTIETGDLSVPTIDLYTESALEDLKERLVIRKINSRGSWRWNLFLKKRNKDKTISEEVLEYFRFSVAPEHRISFPPKRFKAGEAQPYSLSIPLNTLDELDIFLINGLEHLKYAIRDYLFSLPAEERDKIFPPSWEITPASFDDVNFWKGPLGYWSSNVDLKTRFEYGFDKKPTFLCVDHSLGTPRLMAPEYVEENNGISGTFTISQFYVLESDYTVKKNNGVGGEEEVTERRLTCGSTCAVTVANRISTSQMEKLQPSDKIDNTDEIQELMSGDSWKKMAGLQSFAKN